MATRLPLFILGALLVVDGLLSLDMASTAIGVISLAAAASIQRSYSDTAALIQL